MPTTFTQPILPTAAQPTTTTEARLKQLICLSLGDNEPNGAGVIGMSVAALWDINARYGTTGIPLHQFYMTKLAALNVLMGQLLLPTGENTESNTTKARLAVIQAIALATETELMAAVNAWFASQGMSIGQITITAPVGPPIDDAFAPDANASRLAGDPYASLYGFSVGLAGRWDNNGTGWGGG